MKNCMHSVNGVFICQCVSVRLFIYYCVHMCFVTPSVYAFNPFVYLCTYVHICLNVCQCVPTYVHATCGCDFGYEQAHVWEVCLVVYMCSEYTNNQLLVVHVFSACLHAPGRNCCGSTRKELRSSFLMHMTSMWNPFLQGRGVT